MRDSTTNWDLFTTGPLTYSTLREAVRYAQPRRSRRMPKWMAQPSPSSPQVAPPTTRPSKPRLLPAVENELPLVFGGDDAHSQYLNCDTFADPDSDPIEDIPDLDVPQNSYAKPSANGCTPLQSLQEVQKKFLPIPSSSSVIPPRLDLTKFRPIRKHLLNQLTPAPMKTMVCDGFDDFELKVTPKLKVKNVPRPKPNLPVHGLTLVKAVDADQLPLSHCCPDALNRLDLYKSKSSVPVWSSSSYRIPNFEINAHDSAIEVDAGNSKTAEMDRTQAPKGVASKHCRRVSFNKEVLSQLVSLTAPARVESDSASDTETSLDQGSDDGIEQSEDEEMDEAISPTKLQSDAEYESQDLDVEDMIEDDELLSGAGRGVRPFQVISDSIQDDVIFKQYPPPSHLQDLYRPGQVRRMRSTGPWNQAQEDIIDVEDSPPALAIRSLPSHIKPSRSILKNSSRHQEFNQHKVFLDSCNTATGAETAPETRDYFSQASQQLSSQVSRSHFIVPRRHTSQAAGFPENSNDIFTPKAQFTQYPRIPQLVSIGNGHGPCHGSSTRTRNPIRDLSMLLKGTSQQFGTTSSRPRHKTPSLPFVPPFIKTTVEH